ncbi:MAG: hypothetical protein AAFP96_10250, partial [Bacteroidota bacterium]
AKKRRGIVLNILLLGNALIYASPLLYAYITTRPDGNMWSENGPGAILWSYFLVLPICGIVFLVLLVLKLVFKRKKPLARVRNFEFSTKSTILS